MKRKKKVKVVERVNDELMPRLFQRKISKPITAALFHTSVTPNQITVLGFILCMVSVYFFALGTYMYLVIGAVFLQVGYIFDLVDGELARTRKTLTKYGNYLDSTFDGILDPFLVIAIAWGVYAVRGGAIVWFLCALGLYALFEFWLTSRKFLLSYGLSHEKFKQQFSKLGPLYNLFFYARGIHLNLITLGAILNQMYLVLWLLAIVGNIYWIVYLIFQHHSVRKQD